MRGLRKIKRDRCFEDSGTAGVRLLRQQQHEKASVGAFLAVRNAKKQDAGIWGHNLLWIRPVRGRVRRAGQLLRKKHWLKVQPLNTAIFQERHVIGIRAGVSV